MVNETVHGKFVIIDGGSVLECVNYAVQNKIKLCTLNKTGVAIKKKLVPKQWYDTATVLKNYELHDLTPYELRNAERLKLRLLFLGRFADNSDLIGYLLDDFGRFLGVPKRKKRVKA